MAYTYAALRDGYTILRRKMVINADKRAEFNAIATKLYGNISRYEQVEAITGVPASIIAVIHNRESDANFRTYLGNGEPLTRKTQLVPQGRGPWPSWESGAIDALTYQGMNKVTPWTVERACFELEKYNGFGYRRFAANDEDGLTDSPYLWAGTSIQDPGKYVADGKYNRSAYDTQLGCVPLLASIWALDPALRLPMEGEPARSTILPEPAIPPPRPRPMPPDYEPPISPPFGGFFDALVAFIRSLFKR